MTPADWTAATARVVVEACAAHPDDVVLAAGPGLDALAGKVRRVVRTPEPGLSIVALNDVLGTLPEGEQRALLARYASALPKRGLLVIGDVLYSLPRESIDEPEQYGDAPHAPALSALEKHLRELGFLPDTHRFGPARAVIIALKA